MTQTGAERIASDPVLRAHRGGKIEIRNKLPLRTRAELATAYTPGFAHVAQTIHDDPARVYDLTIKRNLVAVVTDGTAVSGLGDVGPAAALPVMEGKAMLFKRFADVDAFPICLGTTDVDEIVRVVKCLEPTFGAVMLEDISAPRCFEIERRLREVLTIPVLHDDQHATACAATAALINALEVVGKRAAQVKVVIVGAGAAGTATAKAFMRVGVRTIVACDRQGAIHAGRADLNDAKRWFAEDANPAGERGTLREVMRGADVFVGLSGPGVIAPADVGAMAKDPIVFALANPRPEVFPDEVAMFGGVVATGRSDLPNQIDCGLCYPGLFRGALDCGARAIDDAMTTAAAYAIAGVVERAELGPRHVVPSIFDERVAPAVAAAVARAAAARSDREQVTAR